MDELNSAIRKPNSVKGDATRNLILDACEILFAQHGYLGTSLRDIASAAGVRMGIVHYHFGNKHLVLEAAVDRKLAVLHERIYASFKSAEDASQDMMLEDMVAAFILPFLRAASNSNDPLRNYIVMTSHLMSSYRLPEIRPILVKLSSISAIFTSYLQKSQPDISEHDLLAGVYLIEAALIFMVQDPGFLDDLSHDYHSTSRLEEMAGPALRFFACGLHGLRK